MVTGGGPRGAQGFSLLEAIVALTILAGSTMALFGWMGGSLNQLNRSELYIEADPALTSAMEYLKFQDLLARPEGTFQSGNITVTWQAVAVEKGVHGTDASNFQLSLFDVALTLRKGDRVLPELHTRIVNYQLLPGMSEQPDEY